MRLCPEIPGGLGGRLECGALVCTEVAELKGGAGQPGREPGPALSRAVEARGARGRTRRGGPFRSPWMEPRLTPGRDALHGGRGSSPSLTFPRFVPLRPTPHLLSLSLSVSPAPSPISLPPYPLFLHLFHCILIFCYHTMTCWSRLPESLTWMTQLPHWSPCFCP